MRKGNRILAIRTYVDPILGWIAPFGLAAAAVALLATLWPLSRLGTEFMPALDEGDLLYMPTALPGLSAGKAAELLQQADRLIKTVPEVASVFGTEGLYVADASFMPTIPRANTNLTTAAIAEKIAAGF